MEDKLKGYKAKLLKKMLENGSDSVYPYINIARLWIAIKNYFCVITSLYFVDVKNAFAI